MNPLKSSQTQNRSLQDFTHKQCEPDNYKTILNLECPVLDGMDGTLRRIRVAAERMGLC